MIRSWRNAASRKVWEGERPRQFTGLDFEAAVDLLLVLNVAKSLADISPLKSVGLTSSRATGPGSGRCEPDRDGGFAAGSSAEMHSMSRSSTTIQADGSVPAVHPGRFLRRELEARGLSANRLALDLGVPSGRITDILSARRSISADTAVRLGRYFGNSPQFWLDLQSQFDVSVVQRERGEEIARRVRPADAA